MRTGDLVCRYAGDRFAVLMPGTDLAAAQVVAERVAENLARAQTLTDAHARWMGSPSHRANALDPALDALGIGVASRDGELYVVALFATHPALSAGR